MFIAEDGLIKNLLSQQRAINFAAGSKAGGGIRDRPKSDVGNRHYHLYLFCMIKFPLLIHLLEDIFRKFKLLFYSVALPNNFYLVVESFIEYLVQKITFSYTDEMSC